VDLEIVCCPTPLEYAAFGGARRSGSGTCVPMLGPRRPWHEFAAARLGAQVVDAPSQEEAAPLPDPPVDAPDVVVAADAAGLREAARLLAGTTGRSLLLTAEAGLPPVERLEGAASLSVVLMANEFPALEGPLLELWRTRPELSIGLLLGRDLQAVTWSVAKALLPEREAAGSSLVISADEKDTDTVLGLEVELVNGRRTSALDVERWRLRDDLESVAISAHGKEDYVHVGQVTLCGLRPGGLEGLRTTRAPQCFFGAGCCKPGQPVPLHDWPAATVFVNSCSSARAAGGLYEPDFAMPLSAVDGCARTYVGTVRAKDICAMEHWLFTGLWRAGCPAGRLVAILNRVGREAIAEEPSFLLVGDPLRRRPRADAEVAELALPAGPRPWLTARGPGRVYYAVHPESEGHRVYAVGDGPRGTTNDPFPDEESGELAAALRDLGDLVLLLPELERLDGPRRELVGRLRQAARLRQRARWDAAAHEEACAAAERTREQVQRVRGSVLDHLRRDARGDHSRVEEVLEESMVAIDHREARCRCGARRDVRRTRHRAFPHLERRRGLCWRCAVDEDSGIAGVELGLEFPEQPGRPGTSVEGRLVVENRRERLLRGDVMIACPQLAGRYRVEPDVVGIEAPPGATVEVPFSLQLGEDVPPHSWVMRAYVLVGMQLAFVRTPLQVAG
jgi:hypothetical protein